MKKILIDLNVILDFLNKRNFHEEAATLVDLCAQKKLEGHLCAHEITTLSYFLLKQGTDKTVAANTIAALMNLLDVFPVDKEILRSALLSPVTDFEDAVIEASAMRNGVDYIVTRNLSDFKQSRVPALTPEQFLVLDM